MDHVSVLVEDLEAARAFFVDLGMESDRLCYVRGPEGIIVALAEELG